MMNFKEIIGDPDEFIWYDMDTAKNSYLYIKEYQEKTLEEKEELLQQALRNAPELLMAIYGEKKPFIQKLCH